MQIDRESATTARVRFCDDARDFLAKIHNSRERDREKDLQKVISTTYHGLLLTQLSAIGEPSDCVEFASSIELLVGQRVIVFLLLFSEPFKKEEWPTGIHPIVFSEQDGPQQLVEAVAPLGIKFQNLLIVTGGKDDEKFERVITGLREPYIKKPGLGPADELPIPFAATKEPKYFSGNDGFLPVVSDRGALGGALGVAYLARTLCFARPLNLTERASIIQDKSILGKLVGVEARATETYQKAWSLLRERQASRIIGTDTLDPRSGAVYFRARDWNGIVESNAKGNIAKHLVPYFSQRLPDYWQQDRPCYRRILFTPTKVLLRGEQYYRNMRNESPFVRVEAMVQELGVLTTLACRFGQYLGESTTDQEWKLVLAFFDQVRSIALQLFSFVHSAEKLFSKAEEGRVRDAMRSLYVTQNFIEDSNIHRLLLKSIDAYYGWAIGRPDLARPAISQAVEDWRAMEEQFSNAMKSAHDAASTHRRSLGELVRRWREADHPGENLMTAMIAIDQLADKPSVDAIGIGWGGIELPLVYGFLSKTLNNANICPTYIAKYSHYRSPNSPILWSPVNGMIQDEEFLLNGGVAALFDDNTLTGTTLERVRDSLLLRGASHVRIFVTRYSGERRFAQMEMEGHGAVDPDALLEDICGYIGETPFARSWSSKSKEYKSPIGVFSLSRRRILECIHNNSTVQLYDREGF